MLEKCFLKELKRLNFHKDCLEKQNSQKHIESCFVWYRSKYDTLEYWFVCANVNINQSKLKLHLTACGTSFTCKRKMTGPRTEPCGAPNYIVSPECPKPAKHFNLFFSNAIYDKLTWLSSISVTKLQALHTSDSKLMCKNSQIFYNSTLRGGYKAGNFTDLGKVPNMTACVRLCCGDKNCDAAFMLERNCYAVACMKEDLCSPVHAKKSGALISLNPRLSYITSRTEEGM